MSGYGAIFRSFYRVAGEGTKLYLLVAENDKTPKQMIETYGQKLIIAAKGAAYYMGWLTILLLLTLLPTWMA